MIGGEESFRWPEQTDKPGFLVQRNSDNLCLVNEPVNQDETRNMFKLSEIYVEKFKVCVINC